MGLAPLLVCKTRITVRYNRTQISFGHLRRDTPENRGGFDSYFLSPDAEIQNNCRGVADAPFCSENTKLGYRCMFNPGQ